MRTNMKVAGLLVIGLILLSGFASAGTNLEIIVQRLVNNAHTLQEKISDLEQENVFIDGNITSLWNDASLMKDDLSSLENKVDGIEQQFLFRHLEDTNDSSTGWNPGEDFGVFFISEPAVTSNSVVNITVSYLGPGVQNCAVRKLNVGTGFNIGCSDSPLPDGAYLNYVVMNP